MIVHPMQRDELATRNLGEWTIKTASDIRDTRNPVKSRVLTWLYASESAMLIMSEGPPLPIFSAMQYLEPRVLTMEFAGQPHKLTAVPIVPNGIIEFPNSMAIAGPKKYMKSLSRLIRATNA